ncbi:type II toxin-antitoxin system PemK/MazF family toxin [Flavobacterium sp. GCM10027622]|uniref:type II toxin-antitoxin system PemK/MazF family toxin n=1 Tax=unclassified Flavobacterium TaxID=196869 RepID=UPI00361F5AF6
MFERGDIVKVYFSLPYQKNHDWHPAIIISNDNVYNRDDMYVCVMLTHFDQKDLFTFEIENYMLVNPSQNKFSQARAHLITYVEEKHFDKYAINKLKSIYVDKLALKIYDDVLT